VALTTRSALWLRRRCQLLVLEYLNERSGSVTRCCFRRQLALGRVHMGASRILICGDLAGEWMALPGSATSGSTTNYYIDGTIVGTIPFSIETTTFRFLGNYRQWQQFGERRNSYFDWAGARPRTGSLPRVQQQSSPSTFYTLLPENIAINVTPLVSYLYVNQTQQFGRAGEQLLLLCRNVVGPAFLTRIRLAATGCIRLRRASLNTDCHSYRY